MTAPKRAAGDSTGAGRTKRAAADLAPAGPAVLPGAALVADPGAGALPPPGGAPAQTSQDRETVLPAGRLSLPALNAGPGTPAPGPVADRASAAGRGRAPQTPAGGAPSESSAPSAPVGLQGAAWRKAVKDAQAKNRRKTTRAASKRPAQATGLPPASPDSAPLIATASCSGCEWTAGPGSMADVDRASDKHVARGHSVAVSAVLGGAA